MAIGICRFLYNNIIDSAAAVTTNNGKTGQVLNALKDGTGSASIVTGGTYTADQDLEYTVQIDSVSGGSEIAQATFRWKTDQDSTWVATGVTTSTTALTLNNGVTVKWVQGASSDFVLNDLWYFKAVNRFSTKKLFDYDRDAIFRTADATGTNVTFDFGSATSFNSLVLLDHNLSAAAVITIEANATDSWGAPTFTETITWNSGKILHYTSTTPNLRYARLTIADAANTDGYHEISEMFLGSYFEPSRTFRPQHAENIRFSITQERNRYNVVRKRLHNILTSFSGSIDYLTSSDITNFETMITTIANTSTESLQPVYFNADSQIPNSFNLMEWEGLAKPVLVNTVNGIFYSVNLSMVELARSLE